MAPSAFASRLESLSWRTFAFSIVLLVIAAVLPGEITVGPSRIVPLEVEKHVLRDIGIALLVGVYLTWTIERVNAEKREQELDSYVRTVGDNFVRAVYGRSLPEDLFTAVKRSVFEADFVRTSYSGDWTLHNFSDEYIAAAPRNIQRLLQAFSEEIKRGQARSDELLVLRLSLSYEVKNVSATTKPYVVAWYVSKPFGGNFEGLCGITSVTIDGKQQLPAGTVYLETAPALGATSPTDLRYEQSVDVRPGEAIRAEVEAYTIRFRDDKEPASTLVPCHGMSIRVTDANGDKDIYITLDAPLLEGPAKFGLKDPNTNIASLNISQYLLPYQGVVVTWTPTRKSEDPTLAIGAGNSGASDDGEVEPTSGVS
jgi:hypothetical protein